MLRKIALLLFLLCMSAFCFGTAEAANEPTYMLTIPADLAVNNEGWNELGSISVTSSSAAFSATNLVITVKSSNDFALVNTADNESIDYTYTTAENGTKTTEFTFAANDINSETGAAQTVGVTVGDFSSKPAGYYEDAITYVVEAVTETIVDLSTLTGDYEAQKGNILTGTLGDAGYKITIAAGATITLSSVDITSIPNESKYNWAGITCLGDATIILSGDNKVKGGYENYPGIQPGNTGTTLTIKGDGSLTASSNKWGAGIGGGLRIACGNIHIQGGTIKATTLYGAGIGSGSQSSCGNITISGGTIEAASSYSAAGIGGGNGWASCGNITITTGVTRVTATAGGGEWSTSSHSIGAGDNGSCGTVTIGGTVYSNGITTSPYTYTPES